MACRRSLVEVSTRLGWLSIPADCAGPLARCLARHPDMRDALDAVVTAFF